MDEEEHEQRTAFERYLRRPGRRRLARVVELFHANVWAMALRSSGNDDDAHDIVQDVFLSLLLHPPSPGSVRSPRGYLAYRVLTFTLRANRSRERRRKREVRAAREAAREALPGGAPEDEEALRGAVAALPERVRQAIQLRYFLGLKNQEIADALGVSERTVEDELREGRDLLRARLAPRLLGVLALAAGGGGAASTAPPARLREELLEIARSGSALAPGRGAGSAVARKVVALACLGIVLAGAAWLAMARRTAAPDGERARAAVLAPPAASPAEEIERGVPDSPPREDAPVTRRQDLLAVSGWVVDEAGEPVAGASVSAYSSPVNLRSPEHLRRIDLLGEAPTAGDGAFHLAVDPPRSFGVTLLARKQGFAVGWARPQEHRHGSGDPGSLEGNLITLRPGAGVLEGRVLDAAGNPLEGAGVWASVKTGSLGEVFWFDAAARGPGFTSTDRAGRFSIGDLPSGSPVDLLFDDPEHLPVRLRHLVPGTAAIEVWLEGGTSFSGRVVDSGGNPVPRALVSVSEARSERTREPPPAGRFQRTGEDGTFHLLGVPAGLNRLEVEAPERYMPVPPRTLEVTGPVHDALITLHAESWIHGIARDRASGSPLEGMLVLVRAGGMTRRLSSAEDGSFSCAVPPGDVEVLPEHGGLSHAPDEDGGIRGRVDRGTTASGFTVWYREKEPPGATESAAIRGKVVDPGGRPIIALVAASRSLGRTGFRDTTRETLAGLDGAFRLENVRLPARLIACAPGRRLVAEAIIEAEGEVTMALAPYEPARIEGRVLAPSRVVPDGAPVAGAGVLASRTVDDKQAPVDCVLSGADGSFVIEDLLPDTQYFLNAQAGAVHGQCVARVVRPGETASVTLWLPGETKAVIEGSIRDADGAALPGLGISHDFSDDETVRFARTLADGEGRFRIEGLCSGRYQLLVDEPGFAVWGKDVETMGPPVEIVLARTRRILFELVDRSGLPFSYARVSVKGPDGSGESQYHAPPSRDGRFAVEVPVTGRRIEIRGEGASIELELDGPPATEIDLGRIVLE